MSDKKLKARITLQDDMSAKLGKIDGNIRQSQSQFAGMTSAVLKANIAFAAITKVFDVIGNVISGTSRRVKEFVTSSLDMASSLEQNKIALDTMLGSAEKASKLLTELSKFAAKTPFNLTELQDLTKQLVAFGFGVDDIIPTLTRLGNISAGVGRDKLPLIVYALGQVRVAGRLMGQDLMQFTNAGVPLIEALAETMGIAQKSVKDYVSEGKIGYKEVEKALRSLSEGNGRFAGLMDRQSESLGGLKSNFGDFVDSVKRRVGGIDEAGNIIKGGLIDKVKGAFESLMTYINENQGVIDEVSEKLSVAIGKLVEIAQSFIEAIISSDKVKEAFGGLKEAVVSLLDKLGIGPEKLDKVEESGGDLAETVVTGVVTGLTSLVEWLEKAYDWFEDNKTTINDVVDAFASIVTGIADVVKAISDFVNKEEVKTFLDIIKKAASFNPINIAIKGSNKLSDIQNEAWFRERGFVPTEGGMKYVGKASGTQYAQGGLTLVGERGPELLSLPRGSKVSTNDQTQKLGGSINVNINLSGAMITNQDQFIEKLKGEITRTLNNQTRLANYGM